MDEQTIDLRELWQIVSTHKLTIGKITVAFLVGAGLYLAIVPPTYQSISLLHVKQDKGLADSILQNLPVGNASETKQKMNTDAEILKSRNVVIPVIRATEEPNNDGEYPDYDTYIKEHITTTPFKDTEILQVAVTGKSPEQAQHTNQLLVDGFLNRLIELSHDEQKATREFIEKRVGTAKTELTDAEAKLQNYQVANKMYSPDDQMKGLTDKLSMVDKAKADNQLDLETAKAALSSINGQLSNAGQSIADSPAIQQYKVQLAQLESTKAGYVGKYTDEHPQMQAVNNQINEAKASLNQEIAKVISQQAPSSNTVQQGLLADKFKNEAMIAVAEGKNQALATLDAQNNSLISGLPAREQGFIRVKRDADVAQEIYIMLAKRLEEAKVAEVMVPNEVQVVDTATLPEQPIKPKKALTMALSLILGIICGAGFVIARSMLNRKIRTADDVEQQLGLPVLGLIPDANSMNEKKKENSFSSWLKRIRRK